MIKEGSQLWEKKWDVLKDKKIDNVLHLDIQQFKTDTNWMDVTTLSLSSSLFKRVAETVAKVLKSYQEVFVKNIFQIVIMSSNKQEEIKLLDSISKETGYGNSLYKYSKVISDLLTKDTKTVYYVLMNKNSSKQITESVLEEKKAQAFITKAECLGDDLYDVYIKVYDYEENGYLEYCYHDVTKEDYNKAQKIMDYGQGFKGLQVLKKKYQHTYMKDDDIIKEAILNEKFFLPPKYMPIINRLSALEVGNTGNNCASYVLDNLHLEVLGEGSSRVVFALNESNVLKVAYNDEGIAQNFIDQKVESSGIQSVPHLIYFNKNGKFLICERAYPINWEYTSFIDRIIDLVNTSEGENYKVNSIKSYLNKIQKKSTYDQKEINFLSKELESLPTTNTSYSTTNALDSDLLEAITFGQDLISLIGIGITDFHLGNFGVVKREGKEQTVVIDTGFNEQVGEEYYSDLSKDKRDAGDIDSQSSKNDYQESFEENEEFEEISKGFEELKALFAEDDGVVMSSDFINQLPSSKGIGGETGEEINKKARRNLTVMLNGNLSAQLENSP